MRLRLPAFGFFILSLLLLWYVKPFTCNSLIDTWFGMLPGQLAATAAVLLISFVGTPKSCGGHMPILQAGPQLLSAGRQTSLCNRNLCRPFYYLSANWQDTQSVRAVSD